ncbi:MAG TPA: aminotransferase class III-fold pyridoxal phosphate-dependent enzyme [Anaerolineales bacterium]|nr:aminotransferase class III-fold pyridoxal phosphate-dependent enzyme [Anaerolineales bacterium]
MKPSHVFYRRMAFTHPIAVSGKGIYIHDSDGKQYIDASGGALVVNIGHGVSEVAQAMYAQAGELAYVHGTMFTSPGIEAYSQQLATVVPIDQPLFYFMSSGSEAVETAIKFSRTVQVAKGESTREVIISRWGSYHGLTLGALAVTGRPKFRTMFAPLFHDQPHIPPPYCYRCPYGATHSNCDLECAYELDKEIMRQGSKRVAAFIAESIGGATLGAIVPPDGYWQIISETCGKHGVLLIADEVMSGFGRTGKWFGIEHFPVKPNLMTMGKGVTGGYFPLSITAVQKEHVETVRHTLGDFPHGSTFSHHAVGAATALATFNYLQNHDLINHAFNLGNYLGQYIQEKLTDLACVGDIRGIGMMWAVEFVKDRVTKEPFAPDRHFSQSVCDRAFQRGVIFYPGSGSVDGVSGDHLMIAPPLVIKKNQIDEVIEILRIAIVDELNKTP